MAKTVMQELIDKYNDGYRSRELFNYFITNKNELLEKEKHLIIDAYNIGNKTNNPRAEDYYNQTYNNASGPVGEVDWVKLRDKFFKECTDKEKYPDLITKVNIAPHDLFEFFKSNIINK